MRGSRPLHNKPTEQRQTTRDDEIRFVIADNGNVTVLDSKGNMCLPDANLFSEPVASVLRALHRADTIDFNISWGSSRSNRNNLAANPFLAQLLMPCTNLYDSSHRLLTFAEGIARLTLHIASDSDGAMMAPCLALPPSDLTAVIISPTLARCGTRLQQIADIGQNWRLLTEFVKPFPADELDSYLSVLTSYFSNLSIRVDGYSVNVSDEPLNAHPTIIIDKIATDNALYLRLDRTIESASDHMTASSNMPELTHIATMTDDRHISIRPISDTECGIDEWADRLLEVIRKCAPTKAAAKEIYCDGNLFIIPEDTARSFLFEALPALLGKYRLVGSEKLHDYKIKPVKPRLRVNFNSGIDFLEGDASVQIDDTTMTLGEFLQQYRSHRYIELSDGTRGVIDQRFMRRIERIFRQDRDKSSHVKVSFFDLPEIEALLDGLPTGDNVLKKPREFYNGFNGIAAQPDPDTGVRASLRSYQTYGVKWLKYLYDNNMGGCLADEMGLGKTLQTIALLNMIYPGPAEPALIVMPRSLLFNWQDELRRFAPDLDVMTYYGQNRNMADIDGHQIILTTYAIVRNDIEELSKRKFHAVVLDESQNIKNISTGVSRSVLLLDTPHRLALSGTPVENNPGELYPLFRFLNPAMFGSLNDFDERYLQPIRRDGDPETIEALRRRIFPFMLRRLKADVLPELPELIDQTLTVDMDDEQARLYEQRRRVYLDRINDTIASQGIDKSRFVMLQALSELRRVASVPESLTDGRVKSPKLDLLAERITEAVTNGHKTVVFFNFIAGIELIGDRLEREGIDYTTMTGSTHDRSSVVGRFQNDPSCMVLLMTLKTGGVGLNLTAADTVFIVEPWWNKAAELQAINRLHRFGQKSTVLCYSLITRGTIEEKIRELQTRKTELFEGLIGADDLTSKKLSEEDINFILS
ncbi:MAG: DEAD/DEAH box helicase [Bacteroidales bacterium]|nr:DEAD/DEAH box helicase [Bacteroidales bacterium]